MDFYINFGFPILKPRHLQWEVLLVTATGHCILHAYRSHCSFDKERIKSNSHIPTKEMEKHPLSWKKKRDINQNRKDRPFTKTQTPRLQNRATSITWEIEGFSVVILCHRIAIA